MYSKRCAKTKNVLEVFQTSKQHMLLPVTSKERGTFPFKQSSVSYLVSQGVIKYPYPPHFTHSKSLSGRRALSLPLRLGVPVLPVIPLPVPLRHHQSCHHGDQHGGGDDQHGGRLRDAQLAVHPGQRGPSQLGRVLARHVAVVVDVEVANVQDLAEDAVQLAVTAPRVAWKGKGKIVESIKM